MVALATAQTTNVSDSACIFFGKQGMNIKSITQMLEKDNDALNTKIQEKLQASLQISKDIEQVTAEMKDLEYKAFKMKENESINEIYSKFTLIINGLKLFEKMYPKKEMEAKVAAVQEAKDLNVLKLKELVGSLMTHEITMKIHDEEETTSKKKNLALKAEASHELVESSDDYDQDMSFITRKFKKFLANWRDRNMKRGQSTQSLQQQRNNSDWSPRENLDAC
ncbi:hypothetical protein RJ640_000269 [Escallonia rubra]|uniref:UBN2 domain-containing protein n=1 Tax=Escallonia rubra TaxID=112253 RepID=A0AA88RJK3_9ASTE|nr:hypothetical protein RJ640_000269 [Escallonia rubra]